MYIEIFLIAILVLVPFLYSGKITTKSFLNEENGYLLGLKEKDYDFYVMAKYGETAIPNKLFATRIKNAFYGTLIIFVFMIGNINGVNTRRAFIQNAIYFFKKLLQKIYASN